jgi:hypothetical protein
MFDATSSALRATVDRAAQGVSSLRGLILIVLVGLVALGGLVLFVARP